MRIAAGWGRRPGGAIGRDQDLPCIVHADESASHGERYEYLSQIRVAEMWNHPEGLENHPLFHNFMDFGPEDRHKTYPNPTLWMIASVALLMARQSTNPIRVGSRPMTRG